MTSRRFITDGPGLPRWSNPISHAVVAGDTCYVSGQLSVSSDGQYVEGSVEDEVRRAFANFVAAVRAAGFAEEEIVFVDFAATDLAASMESINRVFADNFPPDARPAWTLYEVQGLPFGGKVKVMGTAVRRG
jgi:2-iminobutanoate/2-iminopropanoate deaminase